MSWFDTTKGFASLAKTALKEAQKKIDKVLDIQDDELMSSEIADTNLLKSLETMKLDPRSKLLMSEVDDRGTKGIPVFLQPESIHQPIVTPPKTGELLNELAAATTSNLDNFPSKDQQQEMRTGKQRIGEGLPSSSSDDGSDTMDPNHHDVTSSVTESIVIIGSCSSDTGAETLGEQDQQEYGDCLYPPSAALTKSKQRKFLRENSNEGVITTEEEEDDDDDVHEETDNTPRNTSTSTQMDFNANTILLMSGGGVGAEFNNTNTSSSTTTIKDHHSICSRDVNLNDDIQTMDSDSTQSFEDVPRSILLSTTQTTTTMAATAAGAKDKEEKRGRSKLSISSSHQHHHHHHHNPPSDTSPPNSTDELDTTTTTSSDIEIISTPNCDHSSTASVPNALNDDSNGKEDKKSNSNSSPCQMKHLPNSSNEDDGLSCELSKVNKNIGGMGHYREPSEISIISIEPSPSEEEFDKLMNRITELNSIIETKDLRIREYEQQNTVLQNHNKELQMVINANNPIYNTEEYTKRLSSLEKKFQLSIKEREELRDQLRKLQEKIPHNDLQSTLNERQQMIDELRLEGDKLSRDILQQSNIIKKLRAKEKNTDAQLKTQKEQISDMEEELERLKRTLTAKEEVERSQIEAVHKISSRNQQLEKDNQHLRNKLDDCEQKVNVLQDSFELAKSELQQRNEECQKLQKSTEMMKVLEKENREFRVNQEDYLKRLEKIDDNRRSTEKMAMERIRLVLEEKQHLMERIEEAEKRNEEFTKDVSEATIPLMRHIESLQQTLQQRTTIWNREEKQLLEQLEKYRHDLMLAEKNSCQYLKDIELMRKQCRSMEDRLSQITLQNEQIQIENELKIQENKNEYEKKILLIKGELEESRKTLQILENSESNLKTQLKNAEEKLLQYLEIIRMNKSNQTLNDEQKLTTLTSRTHSPANSIGINFLEKDNGNDITQAVEWQQEENSLNFHNDMMLMTNSSTASTLEHLQSLLKQKDGELIHNQWEQNRLKVERNTLQDQLIQLTMELENLKSRQQSYEMLEEQNNDLRTRYDALLQMYGEQVERTDELEMDLHECKEVYKTQIQELLAKMKK